MSMHFSNNPPRRLNDLADISTYQAGVAQSTAQRLLKKFTEDNLRPHGLSMMQWFIVGIIYDAGDTGISVTNLSKAIDTNVPYITNTLNLLASKHIIERNNPDNDNRSKLVTIQPHFIPTFLAIEQDLRVKMRNILYVNLTQQELQTYVHVLYKLNNSLE